MRNFLYVYSLYWYAYIVQYEILEGENFGETVYTKNLWIVLWRTCEIAKAPKIIIMCRFL